MYIYTPVFHTQHTRTHTHTPIRVDHTNFLQVAIKIHSFTHVYITSIYLSIYLYALLLPAVFLLHV